MLELFHALDELQEGIRDVPDHVSVILDIMHCLWGVASMLIIDRFHVGLHHSCARKKFFAHKQVTSIDISPC